MNEERMNKTEGIKDNGYKRMNKREWMKEHE